MDELEEAVRQGDKRAFDHIIFKLNPLTAFACDDAQNPDHTQRLDTIDDDRRVQRIVSANISDRRKPSYYRQLCSSGDVIEDRLEDLQLARSATTPGQRAALEARAAGSSADRASQEAQIVRDRILHRQHTYDLSSVDAPRAGSQGMDTQLPSSDGAPGYSIAALMRPRAQLITNTRPLQMNERIGSAPPRRGQQKGPR